MALQVLVLVVLVVVVVVVVEVVDIGVVRVAVDVAVDDSPAKVACDCMHGEFVFVKDDEFDLLK